MRFSDGLVFVYCETWTFLVRAWWLIALAMLPYVITDVFIETATLALALTVTANVFKTVLFYVFTRFVISGGNLREALSFSLSTCRTFLPFASSFMLLGVATEILGAIGWLVYTSIIELLVLSLVALWAVSAPGGGRIISPIDSMRKGLLGLPWSLAMWMVTALPIYVLITFLDSFAADANGERWHYWAIYGVNLLVSSASTILNFAMMYTIARHLGFLPERHPA